MVSIIVPIYNVAPFIPHCIESLLNQTYTDIQIILVDDGSTDNSGEICDKYEKSDPRITVLHKVNGGLSDARNSGLPYAKGEFVMFVDGDDTLKSNAVETAVSYMKDQVDLVQFKYIEVDCNGSPLYNETFSNEVTTSTTEKEKFQKLYEIGGCSASACTKLYRKHLFDVLQFKVGIIHEDEFFATELLQKCRNIVYIDTPLYNYFIRGGSIVTSPFSHKKMILFELINKRLTFLGEKGYDEFKKFEYRRLYGTILNLYVSAKKSSNFKYLTEIKAELKKAPWKVAEHLKIKDKLIFCVIKAFPFMLDFYASLKK